MKKITFFLSLLTFALIAKAQYPQSLPMDYTQFFAPTAINANGTDLIKSYAVYTDPITPNRWTNGDITKTAVLVDNTLSYSHYIDNNKGKAIVTNASRSYGHFSLTDGTEYGERAMYLSMLINFSATRNEAFIAFGKDYAGNYMRWRLTPIANGNGYKLGLQVNTDPPTGGALHSAVLNKNETYLIVLKMETATSGTERLSLFVNPTIGNNEPTPDATLSAGFILTKIQSISYRWTPTGNISGIRFSDNWEDVVKSNLTKLTQAPVVQNATDVTTTGFTANWTAAPNAVGYNVMLYLNGVLVNSKYVDGSSASSTTFSDLTPGGIYNYKVYAKADQVINSNSDASNSKYVVLDPNAVTAINTDFGDGTWGSVVPAPFENMPASGSYPTSTVNGFNLTNALIYGSSSAGNPKGVNHINSAVLDVLPTAGTIDFPILMSVEQIEIHANSGSGARTLYLKELIGATWTTVATYTVEGNEQIFVTDISRTAPTKFRLENAAYSRIHISQIITRTSVPTVLDAPTVGSASAISSNGFTANWSAVANASGGYRLLVFDATPTLKKHITVPNQSTVSYEVTDLEAQTSYTYKVAAIGDNSSFADSYLSASSASVTTSIISALTSPNASNTLKVVGKNIISSSKANIRVYNSQGALLINVDNVSNLKTNLADGLYIVRCSFENGETTTQKFNFSNR